MKKSSVEIYNGNPTLFVDGRPCANCAYVTYMSRKANYEEFAKRGYTLYSVPLFFSSQTINEFGAVPSLGKGIFDGRTPDFSEVDERMNQIVSARADARIFPRVNISPPRWWEDENPDELCDKTLSGNKRVCFSSDKWLSYAKDCLKIFVEYVSRAPYRDNICGYQIACGNTEEWFGFDMDSSKGLRASEKYNEYLKASGRHDCEGTLYSFLSEMTAKAICELARYVKKITCNQLAVGAFYGYSFESCDRNSGHHALKRVLEEDAIDFLCSPVSYMLNREVGFDHPYMLPLASLKAHGKLYFSENDTRTHLTRPPFDIPHFNKPVWFGRDKKVAIENIKQHFARAFINNHAFWWFDMWGGWYNDDEYLDLMERIHSLMESSLVSKSKSVSEIAVVIDEKSTCYVDGEIAFNVCYHTRKNLGLIGAPYDAYLSSDADKIGDNYKAVIVLAPVMTDELKAIIESKNCFVITSENCKTEVDVLRHFCKNAGVNLYCESDSVVYANDNYLFIHTTCDTPLSSLKIKNLDLILGDEIGNGMLKKHNGYLFKIVE